MVFLIASLAPIRQNITDLVFLFLLVLCLTTTTVNAVVPEHREAYFNGSSYLRLMTPMPMWKHSAFSIRTCRGKCWMFVKITIKNEINYKTFIQENCTTYWVIRDQWSVAQLQKHVRISFF